MRACNIVINSHLSLNHRQWIISKDPGLERTSLPLIRMHEINFSLGLELLDKGLNWQGGIMKHCVGEVFCVEGRKTCRLNPNLVRALLSLLANILEFLSIRICLRV
jgi:hypothetical protein